MYKALYHKFNQYLELKELLLETGDRKIVEHSPYDSYWGDGPDGKGLNRLGVLLMKLRDAFSGKKKKQHYNNLGCDHLGSVTTPYSDIPQTGTGNDISGTCLEQYCVTQTADRQSSEQSFSHFTAVKWLGIMC